MNIIKFYTIAVYLLLLSCTGKTFDANTIDIEQAFNNAQEILLSDFVEHIDYVVLESVNPISKQLRVYSSGNNLICFAYRQIFLFDRQTGAFIREIGRFGRGPGEYMVTNNFDTETQHALAGCAEARLLVEYDLDGKWIRTIPFPQKEGGSWLLGMGLFLDKKTVVYYVNNMRGDTKERLLIADENGNVLKIFDNHNSFIYEGRWTPVPDLFYRHGESTLFFENCVDTIYQVTTAALIPRYELNLGKYHPPYEKKGAFVTPSTIKDPPRNQYFIFDNMGETDNFLFFDFGYKKPSATSRGSFFGYYNKKQRTVKIADVDNNNRRCIVNDIDDFMAIQLLSWRIDDQRNEMISYINAMDIAEWFENNPQKAKELPEHLQKLSKLKPDDNPVVVIAKLK